MSFASRALTQTDTRYTQIELLAIAFACEKFDRYIFGRNVIQVETEHKTLKAIFKKSLCHAPAANASPPLGLQSRSEVQEKSPHVHCGHSEPCLPA